MNRYEKFLISELKFAFTCEELNFWHFEWERDDHFTYVIYIKHRSYRRESSSLFLLNFCFIFRHRLEKNENDHQLEDVLGDWVVYQNMISYSLIDDRNEYFFLWFLFIIIINGESEDEIWKWQKHPVIYQWTTGATVKIALGMMIDYIEPIYIAIFIITV